MLEKSVYFGALPVLGWKIVHIQKIPSTSPYSTMSENSTFLGNSVHSHTILSCELVHFWEIVHLHPVLCQEIVRMREIVHRCQYYNLNSTSMSSTILGTVLCWIISPDIGISTFPASTIFKNSGYFGIRTHLGNSTFPSSTILENSIHFEKSIHFRTVLCLEQYTVRNWYFPVQYYVAKQYMPSSTILQIVQPRPVLCCKIVPTFPYSTFFKYYTFCKQ